MIGVILNEEELFSDSILESIRAFLTINDLTVFREFVGGTHKLLDPFLEELKDNILLHSKVVAIKQDNGIGKDVDNTSPNRPLSPDITGSIRPIEKLTTQDSGRQNGGGVNYLDNAIHGRPSPTFRPVAETVKQSNGKVHVEYVDNSSPDNPSNERKTVTGDYCILTTTAKASLLMDYDPPLTQNKRAALYDLHYEQSTKIFLYFSEAFWIKEGIVGGKSITDGFSRLIYYPSHNFTRGGAILASYT